MDFLTWWLKIYTWIFDYQLYIEWYTISCDVSTQNSILDLKQLANTIEIYPTMYRIKDDISSNILNNNNNNEVSYVIHVLPQ